MRGLTLPTFRLVGKTPLLNEMLVIFVNVTTNTQISLKSADEYKHTIPQHFHLPFLVGDHYLDQ